MKVIAWTWAANAAAILVACYVVGGVNADRLWTVVVAGLVFTGVNLLVRPVVRLLALPFIVITFGLVLFFVNMLMLALTAWLVKPFEISGFGALVKGTLVVWLVNVALSGIVLMAERHRVRSQGAHA